MTIPQIGADRIRSLGCKCDVRIAVAVDIGNREVVQNSGQWQRNRGLAGQQNDDRIAVRSRNDEVGASVTIEISGLRDLRDRRYHRRVSHS